MLSVVLSVVISIIHSCKSIAAIEEASSSNFGVKVIVNVALEHDGF